MMVVLTVVITMHLFMIDFNKSGENIMISELLRLQRRKFSKTRMEEMEWLQAIGFVMSMTRCSINLIKLILTLMIKGIIINQINNINMLLRLVVLSIWRWWRITRSYRMKWMTTKWMPELRTSRSIMTLNTMSYSK